MRAIRIVMTTTRKDTMIMIVIKFIIIAIIALRILMRITIIKMRDFGTMDGGLSQRHITKRLDFESLPGFESHILIASTCRTETDCSLPDISFSSAVGGFSCFFPLRAQGPGLRSVRPLPSGGGFSRGGSFSGRAVNARGHARRRVLQLVQINVVEPDMVPKT